MRRRDSSAEENPAFVLTFKQFSGNTIQAVTQERADFSVPGLAVWVDAGGVLWNRAQPSSFEAETHAPAHTCLGSWATDFLAEIECGEMG